MSAVANDCREDTRAHSEDTFYVWAPHCAPTIRRNRGTYGASKEDGDGTLTQLTAMTYLATFQEPRNFVDIGTEPARRTNRIC